MLRTRQAGRAFKALAQTSRQHQRCLTTSTVASTIQIKKNGPAGVRNQATSAQSTAYVGMITLLPLPFHMIYLNFFVTITNILYNLHSQARDVPAPAFNTASTKDRSHVQPLVSPRAPEMDESYV